MAHSSNFQDLTGKRFGFLVATEFQGLAHRRYWLCKCDCGKTVSIAGSRLRNGRTRSCGCKKRELIGNANRKHGHFGSPTYTCWVNMWKRCFYKNDDNYARYGGSGITMCDRWRNFENFLADMGERPSLRHTLDRYPKQDGNYEPGNVRWATTKEQNRNRRTNRLVAYRGETKPLIVWCEELGLKYGMVRDRIRHGWDAERAFTTPRRKMSAAG